MNFSKSIISIIVAIALIVSSISIDGLEKVQANDNDSKLIDQKNQITSLITKQEEELSSSNTIVTSNDANEYNLTTFESDVQIQNGHEWKAIDTTLVPSSDGGFVTKETQLDIRFSEELDSETSFIEVTNGAEQKVEFSLSSIETSDEIIPIQKSEGVINGNEISYQDILKGVDLRHIVLNTEIKEDVILREKIEGLKSINYKLTTKLTPTLSQTGELVLSDHKGKKIYEMPAPQMSDSQVNQGSGFSEPNYDIEYQLIKKEDYYELKLVPTSNWLEEDRVYPVYIDPTLVKNVSLDTFVTSAAPDRGHNQYWNSTLGQYVLRVGKYDASTGTNYAFVKLYTLDNLKGANVTSATLKTFANWSYYATTKTEMWVDRVASSWSENNVTWNTRPPSIGITSAKAARNEWASFNVTNAVQEIVSEKRSDYGFKFHANGNEMTHWKQLSAGENGKNVTNLSVTYSYPQMQAATTNTFPSGVGSTTGYIDVSWPSVSHAKGYRLQLFDGKGWQTVYDGSSTSFTTKNKKIWPLSSQYNVRDSTTGGIKFRIGDGQELPMDPTEMYSKSSGVTTTSKAFQFRVIADYPLGSSTPSKISKPVLDGIIPDTPAMPQVAEYFPDYETGKGNFTLEWDEVEGATAYDLQFFNGLSYESIPVGNVTKWTSKDKNIFPTDDQLNISSSESIFRKNQDGQDFSLDPRVFYKTNNENYQNTSNYFIKLVAKSSKGTSLASPTLRVWFPTAEPKNYGKGFLYSNETEGYANLSWDPVNDAQGYLISLFNGREYQPVANVDSETTFWSSKHFYLWPKTLISPTFLTSDSEDGVELPFSPEKIYEFNSDFNKDVSKYYFKVQSYRYVGEDVSLEETDQFKGISSVSDYDLEIELNEVEHQNSTTNKLYPAMSLPNVEIYVDYIYESNDETISENFDEGISSTQIDESEEKPHIKNEFMLDWDKVAHALKYQIVFYNGVDYTFLDVPGNQTQWSSSGKNIFPTEAQIANGELNFRPEEDGSPLPKSPRHLYTHLKNKNAKINIQNFDHYYVGIKAILADGSTTLSELQSFEIPDEKPQVLVTKNYIHDNQTREIELSWFTPANSKNELLIFNGIDYTPYSLDNKTYWNSEQSKIFKNENGVLQFTILGAGESLPAHLTDLYAQNNLNTSEISILPEYKFIVRSTSPQRITTETEVELYNSNNELLDLDSELYLEENEFGISSRNSNLPRGIRRTLVQRITEELFHIYMDKQAQKNKKPYDSIRLNHANISKIPAENTAERYMFGKAGVSLNGGGLVKKKVIVSQERLKHILFRHDVRFWDGSLGAGGRQTFFPKGTSTQFIMTSLAQVIKTNASDINNQIRRPVKAGSKYNRVTYTARINGMEYQVGIRFYRDKSMNPRVDQFFPTEQYWYLK